MQYTAIGWAEVTWNPARGCTRVSPGCQHCYAETMAARYSDPGLWGHGFAKRTKAGARWTGRVELISHKLEEPLRWKKPRMVFVNSTSDLWHEKLSEYDVERVYDVMWCASQHTFQVLTKRPARRRDILRQWGRTTDSLDHVGLPNVWEGTSVENRDTLHRIDELRNTPAAVRWISFEPLLERLGAVDLTGIDWIVIGGESGPGARAMSPAWVDEIIDKADEAGVAVFVKQLGSVLAREWGAKGKGEDMERWPESWRRREWPKTQQDEFSAEAVVCSRCTPLLNGARSEPYHGARDKCSICGRLILEGETARIASTHDTRKVYCQGGTP